MLRFSYQRYIEDVGLRKGCYMDVCDRCGVPIMVSRELNWEANGVISLASSPRNRMVFYESENIDLERVHSS